MLISDVLKQAVVTYNDGDILAAQLQPTGYAPSILDTETFNNGVYNYKVKGVGTATGAVAEKDTLTITNAATAAGNVTVTLNGHAVNVAVLSGDTASAVATKIAAGTYTGFTAAAVGAVVTFTATATGAVALPTYNANATGALGNIVVTVAGAAAGFAQYNIVPIVLSADGKSFMDDVANPVIVQTAGKVVYMTGRNDVNYNDVYQDRALNTMTGITLGQEARTALQFFMLFAQSEYSIGVNDFTAGGPTYAD